MEDSFPTRVCPWPPCFFPCWGARAGCCFPFLSPGLRCASSPAHTSPIYWREPGEPVHVQVSWGFSSELSRSMTRTSGWRPPWDKGPLVQSSSVSRVESRLGAAAGKSGEAYAGKASGALQRRWTSQLAQSRLMRWDVQADPGGGPGNSPPWPVCNCISPAVYASIPMSSMPVAMAPARQMSPSTAAPSLSSEVALPGGFSHPLEAAGTSEAVH